MVIIFLYLSSLAAYYRADGALKSADAIFLGFAGSNGFRFLRQFVDYGLKDKMQVIGGMTALDEAVLAQYG